MARHLYKSIISFTNFVFQTQWYQSIHCRCTIDITTSVWQDCMYEQTSVSEENILYVQKKHGLGHNFISFTKSPFILWCCLWILVSRKNADSAVSDTLRSCHARCLIRSNFLYTFDTFILSYSQIRWFPMCDISKLDIVCFTVPALAICRSVRVA